MSHYASIYCALNSNKILSRLISMANVALFAYSTMTWLNAVLNVALGMFSDDDSEPILGLWFEETISPSKEKVAPPPPPPPPPLETSPRLKSPSKLNTAENGNILASRKDPELVRPRCVEECWFWLTLLLELKCCFMSCTNTFVT